MANGTALARARLAEDLTGLTELRVIFSQQPKVASQLHFGCRIQVARHPRVGRIDIRIRPYGHGRHYTKIRHHLDRGTVLAHPRGQQLGRFHVAGGRIQNRGL